MPCEATFKIFKVRLIVTILTSILVGILSCLTTAIYISQVEKDYGVFFYAFIMIFGNVILPIFLTTCLYAFLKRKITFLNKFVKYFMQVGLLILLSALGLCFMTFSKVVSYYSGFSGMTFENLKESFKSSFQGYIPEVILYSFLIPLVYLLVEIKLIKSTVGRKF